MKFLALIAIVAAADEKKDDDSYDKVPALGKCDASKEKSGCVDKHRCGSEKGEGVGICIPEDLCGESKDDKTIECGAKTLLASTFAALALASAM